VEQRSANRMAAGEGASAAKAARPAVETMSATSAADLTCRNTARPNCKRGTSPGGDRARKIAERLRTPSVLLQRLRAFF
jgi:hypothetical protein